MKTTPVLASTFVGLFFLTAVLGFVSASPALVRDTAESSGSGEGVVDLRTEATGLSFRLRISDFAVDGQGRLSADQLNARTTDPGKPELPYYATFVAIPAGANLRISVEEPESHVRDQVLVPPAPDRDLKGYVPDLGGHPQRLDEALLTSNEDPFVYGHDDLYPGDLFAISEPMQLGELQVIRLSLFPLRHNPVRKQLLHAVELTVKIDFGIEPDQLPMADGWKTASQSGGDYPLVINAEQAAGWRQSREAGTGSATVLPVGRDVYKVELDTDGIYEVSYGDLQAAGMAVDNIDRRTLELVHRGEPVAYQFVGDGDSLFEPNERIRFYGWAFAGSRLERQYVRNNVFWLWAGGRATSIPTIGSKSGTNVTSFRSSVTEELEQVWFPTWTDGWDQFPNEPDAWYWDMLTKAVAGPITKTYTIMTPYPELSGPDALLTAEFSSKWSPVVGMVSQPHSIRLSINGLLNVASSEWFDKQNVNVTGTIPLATLASGQNQVMVTLATQAQVPAGNAVYLNRVTVDYRRQLLADGDQLIFADDVGGLRQFEVGGFATNSLQQFLAWDITNRRAPIAIDPSTLTVSGSGPYSIIFGTEHPANSRFVATTTSNVLVPKLISKYVPPSLEPPGGADWVAVTYHDFVTETQRLASHRQEADFGDFRTSVVDVADVVNQYGYGLPLPGAIRDYMSHAVSSWAVKPRYLTLVGDATVDPRHLNPSWPDAQLVPADLAFVDRYQGEIPSDYVYTLVSGNDLLPDIAVGRIPARSIADASAMVDKIIRYDQNQVGPSAWMRNFTFLADNADSAGNFCLENRDVGAHLPADLNYVELCLVDNPTESDAENLRSRLFSMINVTGTILLSYRGHGGVDYWAGSPSLMSSSDIGLWNNAQKPLIIVTGDCLDGFFAYPPVQGLGETLMRASKRASAAYWSASGFGFSSEHTVLEQSFYDAVYNDGLVALGDAANQAKLDFVLAAGHPSILYSFVLLGDPAMKMAQPFNLAPVANDDVYASSRSGVTVPAPGVLANDTDPDGIQLTAKLTSTAKHGTLDLESDGSFSYKPDPAFAGVDAFFYEAIDSSGAKDAGKVTILVSGDSTGPPPRAYLPLLGN
ncbi:MAG: C25 family cysteine peptidase [Candidatus Promineifilaceae bacterium]